MQPSDFTNHPYDSVMKNSESETVARNIMVILSRTGNKFRHLSWNEYKKEREKDGNFSQSEQRYFEKVAKYTVSEQTAALFSEAWAGVSTK